MGMLLSWIFSIPERLRLMDMRSNNKKLARKLDDKELELSETKGKLSQAETQADMPIVVEKTIVLPPEER